MRSKFSDKILRRNKTTIFYFWIKLLKINIVQNKPDESNLVSSGMTLEKGLSRSFVFSKLIISG